MLAWVLARGVQNQNKTIGLHIYPISLTRREAVFLLGKTLQMYSFVFFSAGFAQSLEINQMFSRASLALLTCASRVTLA